MCKLQISLILICYNIESNWSVFIIKISLEHAHFPPLQKVKRKIYQLNNKKFRTLSCSFVCCNNAFQRRKKHLWVQYFLVCSVKVRVKTDKKQFEMKENEPAADQAEEETINGKEIIAGLDGDTQWHVEETKQVEILV